MKSVTDFSKIEVDAVNHGYSINGKNLISATTLIKSITPAFDREGLSLRSAERDGVSQAEILRRWELKGVQGRDRGTRLHQYVEDVMDGKIDPVLQRGNERIPEMEAFDQAWTRLRAELGARRVKQEWVIGDEELGVAGRIDNLMAITKPDRLFCVFDWKTGKLDIENRFGRLLPPFQKYDASKFNQYSIQLSLYRLILERNQPRMTLSDGYILHLRDDSSYHIHRARDFRGELQEWLKGGVPDSVKGDPACEKRAQGLTQSLLTADPIFARSLSARTNAELGQAARRLLKILAVEGDDES